VQSAFHLDREQHAGLKVGGDAERFEVRGKRRVRVTAIERRHHADLGRTFLWGEASHHVREILRRHGDVRVVDQQVVVLCLVLHLDQRRDFFIGAELLGADEQTNGVTGKFLLQLLDHGDGRVACVGHAEEQFVLAGVTLSAVAAKGLKHAGVAAFERLQNTHARREVFLTLAAFAQKACCGPERGNKIAHARDGENGGDDLCGDKKCVRHTDSVYKAGSRD